MKYPFRRFLLFLLVAIFASALPNDAFAEEKKPAMPMAKEHSSANNQKTSTGKSQPSEKKSDEEPKSSIRSSSNFSKAEIERYRAMPYQTWESPRGISELGLPIAEGYAQPYPYGNLMRQYDGNRCRHRALDIGAVGEEFGGLGTVVNSATPAVVTLIGKVGRDVKEFGRVDKRSGMAKRSGKMYPRRLLVPGYGVVYPFSRTYGRWRSGTVLVVRVTDGPLKDYTLRYMHLADVRPDLKVGSKIEAGEHIGLMGGTAIMDSWPHVHIDLTDPNGKRLDPAPYIGLQETISHCSKGKSSQPNPVMHLGTNSTASPEKKKPSNTADLIVKRPRQCYLGTLKIAPVVPQMRKLSRG